MCYFTKIKTVSEISLSRAIYVNYAKPDIDLNDIIRGLVAHESLGN
ncbi:hypothetical protein ALTER154_80631 [Alteromonas sp. 154]|nr:hypothetical protein ALTER154_80631 [Alteromonas sp. 154]